MGGKRVVDYEAWARRPGALVAKEPKSVRPRGCNPTRYDIDPSDEEPQRRLLCRRHSECLHYAAVLDWPSFHCGGCRVRDEAPRGGDEDRDDYGAIWRLLREVMTGSEVEA